MIRIEIRSDKGMLKLAIKGHAGYAPIGYDIVCSAVTSTAYTLAAYAEKQGAAQCIRLDPGDILIKAEDTEKMRTAFELIGCGLRMIANTYPENAMVVETPNLT